jgi:hypothetical protein
MTEENRLVTDTHVLVLINDQLTGLSEQFQKESEYILRHFCGAVLTQFEPDTPMLLYPESIVYLTGDIQANYNRIKDDKRCIVVIRELSYNFDNTSENYRFVSLGQVPINLHNVGVYFRNFFDPEKDYFNLIDDEHKFQVLKESNKTSNAFRKGIYLTEVEQINPTMTRFNLLRCSTNMNGPTDNFRTTDREIIGSVNSISERFFEQKTNFNHVLAQIYQNQVVNNNNGDEIAQKKAKIKEHSDKTKDMPRNGLMAFCTFYKNYHNNQFNDSEMKNVKVSSDDMYNYCYNKTSVLTRLRFRLKPAVENTKDKSKYAKLFDVTLYPNSVFIMSLDMNRLYTHEIVPSILPIDKIPTRMGYVIRCSATKSVFKDDQTYIIEDDQMIRLERPTDDDIKRLRELYFKENTSIDIMDYGNIHFSMNDGDYTRPIAT